MDPNDPAQMQHLLATMAPLIGGFILVGLALVIVPYWQIFKKAGFPAPLALLMFIPLINLIMLYVLAFSRWKVVPAPEYMAGGYPPTFPPAGYPPQGYPPPPGYGVPAASPSQGYTPPGGPAI